MPKATSAARRNAQELGWSKNQSELVFACQPFEKVFIYAYIYLSMKIPRNMIILIDVDKCFSIGKWKFCSYHEFTLWFTREKTFTKISNLKFMLHNLFVIIMCFKNRFKIWLKNYQILKILKLDMFWLIVTRQIHCKLLLKSFFVKSKVWFFLFYIFLSHLELIRFQCNKFYNLKTAEW